MVLTLNSPCVVCFDSETRVLAINQIKVMFAVTEVGSKVLTANSDQLSQSKPGLTAGW